MSPIKIRTLLHHNHYFKLNIHRVAISATKSNNSLISINFKTKKLSETITDYKNKTVK